MLLHTVHSSSAVLYRQVQNKNWPTRSAGESLLKKNSIILCVMYIMYYVFAASIT